MKNYIFIASASLLMSSCNQAEIDRVNHQKDSLQLIINEQNYSLTERDSSISDYISYFKDVERNLDSITAKQQMITVNSDKSGIESKENTKIRITSQIETINSLIDQNRKTIASLNKKLKSSGRKNAELEKMILKLNNELEQKSIELAALNQNLTELNLQIVQLQTSMEMLTVENAAKSQNISEQTAALHTAYYVMGKSKDLQELNIIDRKGGLLGMGRTSKLNENVDKSKFTQIDYTRVGTIAINDDAKIITTHPSDSYTLEKDGKDKKHVKNLTITNPEKFWSASKFLVIVKG